MMLTVDQVAERLGTTTRHVRRLVSEGCIAYLRVGRYIRIDDGDLLRYLDSCRVDAAAPGVHGAHR